MKCPVCDSELNSLSCPVCGFDASRDYERFPTFAPIREAVSAAGLRDRRAPKDALRCEKCGSTAFPAGASAAAGPRITGPTSSAAAAAAIFWFPPTAAGCSAPSAAG